MTGLGPIQAVVEGGIAAVHVESATYTSRDTSFEGGLQEVATTLTVTFALDD